MKTNKTPFWERKVKYTPYKNKELLGVVIGAIIGTAIVYVFNLLF